jgi:4-amino-4-deoxy-L-arabinose transferase-like glycosyltransferase
VENRKYERLILALILAAVVLLSLHMGLRTMWDPDEGRYAEMGREVLIFNDWVTPRLDYLNYFEKPMMFMWMEALSQKVFGINEIAARIPPLLCAFGGVFLVWMMAVRLWGKRAGLITGLVLLTSAEYFVLTNSVDINMPLAFFITAAMVFFWIAHTEKKPVYYYLMWLSAALAFLTKGPVGVILPVAAILLYIIITKQFRLIIDAKPITGLLLFLAVSLPWYILVCRKNPAFFNFFFIDQNLMRYTSKIHHRYQPWWYFIPVIIGGFIPWTFLVPGVLKDAFKRPVKISNELLYLIIWFAVVFFFFMPSQSKLVTYVLPCFTPMSLLMGYAFKDHDAKGGKALNLVTILWVLLGVAMLILPVLSSYGLIKLDKDTAPLAQVGIPMGLIMLTGSLAGLFTGKKAGTVAGIGVMAIFLMFGGLLLSPAWNTTQSTKEILKDLPAEASLYTYQKYLQSSTFYAKRPVYLVESEGELVFGQNIDRRLSLTKEDFFKILNTRKNIYVLAYEKYLPEIQTHSPNIVTVGKYNKLLLLTNQPSVLKQKQGTL